MAQALEISGSKKVPFVAVPDLLEVPAVVGKDFHLAYTAGQAPADHGVGIDDVVALLPRRDALLADNEDRPNTLSLASQTVLRSQDITPVAHRCNRSWTIARFIVTNIVPDGS